MTDQIPLSDAELAELHALALVHAAQAPASEAPVEPATPAPEAPITAFDPEPAPLADEPIAVVPRDYSMGPATGANIKAFLERKQAEADAKAAAG